ncbi:hypothetical protein OOJ91_11845 [Micromonospora lupini]|uniref:hypothetical protein n=1 Tax=Micromonospora lupini TaxID=285679 RepID=UPI00225298D4|nr:hypothetical protein [Micromonospora lupini]
MQQNTADAATGNWVVRRSGLAGFFADSARRPPPPGIPTVRAFQQAQADAPLPWLAQRLA